MLEFLKDNAFFLLVVLAYGLSALGGVLTRATRKAAERQREVARQQRRQPGAEPRQPPAGRGAGEPPTDARDIAREIRRAMGLEELETFAPPETAPAPQPAVAPPPPVTIVADRPQRVGLREKLERESERRDAERQARHGSRGEAVSGRKLDKLRPHIGGRKVARRQSHRAASRLVDLSRPAAALVAMEIFSPPVAMRRPGSGPLGL